MSAPLIVLATEGGIPPTSPWAQLAVPIGILFFVGSVYLLLRSNLGTRRGYLVLSTSLWGFTALIALFWAFGAPGTPPATGPQNLPGQELDEYEPVFRPFAIDSQVAGRPEYAVAQQYPQGWGEVPPEHEELAQQAVDEIRGFFSDAALPQPRLLSATMEDVEIRYAEAGNGFPMFAVTYQETFQAPQNPEEEPAGPVGEIDPAAEPVVAFAFFDAGNPVFPSLLMFGITLALFLLHMALLNRDEAREHAERMAAAEGQAAPPQPVGTSA